jgi:hypothetical protein
VEDVAELSDLVGVFKTFCKLESFVSCPGFEKNPPPSGPFEGGRVIVERMTVSAFKERSLYRYSTDNGIFEIRNPVVRYVEEEGTKL